MNSKIDVYLNEVPAWQSANMSEFRALIHEVAPEVIEDWKWSVPVFSKNGRLVCAMSGFKNHTKFNFFEGASLVDPDKYLNGGLDSKKHRSLDLAEGEIIYGDKLRSLLRYAFI